MADKSIEEKVKDIIVEQLGVNPEQVTPTGFVHRGFGRGLARHCGAGDGIRGGIFGGSAR